MMVQVGLLLGMARAWLLLGMARAWRLAVKPGSRLGRGCLRLPRSGGWGLGGGGLGLGWGAGIKNPGPRS